MNHERDLEFLYELGTLRNMPRGWKQHLDHEPASVMEHTVRVMWLALIIAKMEGLTDFGQLLKMALVHDMAETRTSDLGYIQKVYAQADENKAVEDMFDGTIISDFLSELKSYEARDSLEAKIVKDADNLDVDLEMKEMEEQGSKLPEKWKPFRQKVREEKLYTESAKKLWDEIQTSDVSSWHLKHNKWLRMPNAGK
ncbi:MAG: HD domain-containing protein [Candidatus Saccharibacteria bacterium]